MLRAERCSYAIGGDLRVERIGFGAMRLAAKASVVTALARMQFRAARSSWCVNHTDATDFYRCADRSISANDPASRGARSLSQ